jgi:hypothetical protein
VLCACESGLCAEKWRAKKRRVLVASMLKLAICSGDESVCEA